MVLAVCCRYIPGEAVIDAPGTQGACEIVLQDLFLGIETHGSFNDCTGSPDLSRDAELLRARRRIGLADNQARQADILITIGLAGVVGPETVNMHIGADVVTGIVQVVGLLEPRTIVNRIDIRIECESAADCSPDSETECHLEL